MNEYNGFILKNPHDGNYQICIKLKGDKYWQIDAAFPKDFDVTYYSDSGLHELPRNNEYLASFKIERFIVLRMLKARRDTNSEPLIPSEKLTKSRIAVGSLESAVDGEGAMNYPNYNKTSFKFDDECDTVIGKVLLYVRLNVN